MSCCLKVNGPSFNEQQPKRKIFVFNQARCSVHQPSVLRLVGWLAGWLVGWLVGWLNVFNAELPSKRYRRRPKSPEVEGEE